MSTKDEAAFPRPYSYPDKEHGNDATYGLTQRDFAAIEFVKGALSNPNIVASVAEMTAKKVTLAGLARAYADALFAELEK